MENLEAVQCVSDETLNKIKIVEGWASYSGVAFLLLVVLKLIGIIISFSVPYYYISMFEGINYIRIFISILMAVSFIAVVSSLMYLYLLKTGGSKTVKVLGVASVLFMTVSIILYFIISTISGRSIWAIFSFVMFVITLIITPILFLSYFITIARVHKPVSFKQETNYSIRPFLISVILIVLTIMFGAYVLTMVGHIDLVSGFE